MRRFLATCLACLLCLGAAGAYVAYPFLTVWKIREAIRNGDSAYLADTVEWASLKQSLKPSIGRMAFDFPPEEGEDWAGAKPTVWQRVKAYFGQGMVDRVVDKYVTPEGLPQLFSYRKAYRKTVTTTPSPADDRDLPLSERIQGFWARVKRAEFVSLSRFEIDVVDKENSGRLYAGTLQLVGWDWKLTGLQIRQFRQPDAVAAAAREPGDPQER